MQEAPTVPQSSPQKTSDAATPDNVATLATDASALPLNGLALLGVFGPPDARAALIRMPKGEVLRVTSGGVTPVGEIIAITADSVILSYRGRSRRLSMPR